MWTPEEIVRKERDDRVKALQDSILLTIKNIPIPPEEVCAALGGCAVYIIGLNTEQFGQAMASVAKMKREMKLALSKHWPNLVRLRKEIASRVHETQQEQIRASAPLEDSRNQETGRSSTEDPRNDVQE